MVGFLLLCVLGKPGTPCPPPPPPPTEKPVGLPGKNILLTDDDEDEVARESRQPHVFTLMPKPAKVVITDARKSDNSPQTSHRTYVQNRLPSWKNPSTWFNRRGIRNH